MKMVLLHKNGLDIKKNGRFAGINDFFEKNEIDNLLLAIKGDLSFFLVYHTRGDLESSAQYIFAQDYYWENDYKDFSSEDANSSFRNCLDKGNFGEEKVVDILQRYPMIHITEKDLFGGPDEDLNGYCIRRYQAIMDCSIWNYYVPICRKADNYNFSSYLKSVLNEIADNYRKGYYSLKIGYEYVNLFARLTRESYLLSAAHGDDVSPFLFHSENEFKLKVEALKEESILFTSRNKSGYKWHFLLLDDYANRDLKVIGKDDNNSTISVNTLKDGKLKVILLLLNKLGFKIAWTVYDVSEPEHLQKYLFHENGCTSIESDYYNYDILIYCAHCIKEAEYLMQYNQFEIILLDYLLSKDSDSGKREYSYELLKKIANQDKITEGYLCPRPHNRFFFMYISAFTTAISERLQETGLLRSTEYWHISQGACPTNTPYLFLYYLLKLMEKRVVDMGISRLIVPRGKISQLKEDHWLVLLRNIFCVEDNSEVRALAAKNFRKILSLRYHFDTMREDAKQVTGTTPVSALASTFMKDPRNDISSFLEHIVNLIYTVAFGTVRQWADLWEEYIIVKPLLMEMDELEEAKEKKLCDKIERYIISLRNSNL